MNEKIAKLFKKKIFDGLDVRTGEGSRMIRGIFDVMFFEREVKGRLMATSAPFFLCASEDAKDIKADDEVSFSGSTYYVSKVNDDKHGLSVIHLRETYEDQRREGEEINPEEVVGSFLDQLKRKPRR